MTEGIPNDVVESRRDTLEVCDVLAEAAGALLLWCLITWATLRTIVTTVIGSGARWCWSLAAWALSPALFVSRIVCLNVFFWWRGVVRAGIADSWWPYGLSVEPEAGGGPGRNAPLLSDMAWVRRLHGALCVLVRLIDLVHRASLRAWVTLRHLHTITFKGCCRCVGTLMTITLFPSEISGRCRLLTRCVCEKCYDVMPSRLPKIRKHFPLLGNVATCLTRGAVSAVRSLVQSLCQGLAHLSSGCTVILNVLGKLLGLLDEWLDSRWTTLTGSRLQKDKPRYLIASLCRRLFYFRCSPRFSFIAFLVGVSISLSICLYLSHVTKSSQYSHQPEVPNFQKINIRNNLLNNDKPEPGTEQKRVRDRNRWKEKGGMKNKGEGDLPSGSWKQVSDVINLMGRYHLKQNHTATPLVHMEDLLAKIKYLREEMTSQKNMLPKLSDLPSCVGDLMESEVEDLLCIPRPKYLSHIKNPCWYDTVTGEDGQEVKKLRCLPYFHILGCAKSGTTDLWNRLLSHPHVIANDGLLHKEALWWSWRRYGYSGYHRRDVMNFSQYVDLYNDTARIIENSIMHETLVHQIVITGDASPPDFWDFRGWTNISQNRNFKIPHVITPHLMKHFYRDPKFILMFRDPIDRLYSDYFFVGGGLTSLDFHNDVLASIDMVYNCVWQFGLTHCFYDHELYIQLPVRLPFACYSVFMREWLQVFPLENFMFIKTEDYKVKPEKTLRDVMDFLGLGPLKETLLQEIVEEEKSRITEQRKIAGPIQNATKDILHELLDPCSSELANLIQDKNFIWN